MLPPSVALPNSPPPSLLPSSSRKRSRSPSLPLPPVSSPQAVSSFALAAVALACTEHETVTLCARYETLEQKDTVTRDSLRITKGRITRADRLEMAELQSRAHDIESRLKEIERHFGHYKDECSKLKNQNYGNQKGNEGKARGNTSVVADNVNA
nr:hypothetical protein [Tanacetum cinerariifolium]GEW97806.1 hypothetical protein [Tanacetum cinerariifolium]GEX05812.1 hypothetical protein [Tanacetum cinerariifolium]